MGDIVPERSEVEAFWRLLRAAAPIIGSELGSPGPRVLFEVEKYGGLTAAQIASRLGLDRSQVTRVLSDLEARALVSRKAERRDRRRLATSLTVAGRSEFEQIGRRLHATISAALRHRSPWQRRHVVSTLETLANLLENDHTRWNFYTLRPPNAGDLGWIVHRQGVLARDHLRDHAFEAHAASIIAEFAQQFDARRECCWIVDREGEIAGAAILRANSNVAQSARLRLLYVEPTAPGLGIAGRLLDEARRFAREARYTSIVVSAHDILDFDSEPFEEAGYELVDEQLWERRNL